MNCPYPEHHDSGGSSWAGPITVILVAMVAAAVLGAVLHMIELALTIAGAVLLGGAVGLVLWHLHRRLSGPLPVWQRVPHLQPAVRCHSGKSSPSSGRAASICTCTWAA